MKRIGNLKQKWCNYEALLQAFNEVKTHKSTHENFLRYEGNLVVNLENILKQLETETYQVKETRAFYVYDPKLRLIEAPHLEDRIVQHAVLNSFRKEMESRFIHQTFGCIKNRGTHRASDLLKKYLITYKDDGYYLKIDIRKFFYSINHEILKKQINGIIKCKPTLDLLYKLFDNEAKIGLPLGSVTSQVLANLNLSSLDHYAKRELGVRHYIRYMDDIIILHKDKNILRKWLAKLRIFISTLSLKFNDKTKIGKVENGIDFVGYKTWYNRRVIRKRSLYKIKRTLKKDANEPRIASYLAHAKRTNSINYVVQKTLESAPSHEDFVNRWIFKNKIKERLYDEILSINASD